MHTNARRKSYYGEVKYFMGNQQTYKKANTVNRSKEKNS